MDKPTDYLALAQSDYTRAWDTDQAEWDTAHGTRAQAAALIAIAQELRRLNERLAMVTDETNKCVQVFAWTQEN